jgi:type I restriction enzyme S subunit
MMLLRTNNGMLDGAFTVLAFYSPLVRPRMLALASGVTAKHLNVADVKRLAFPLPPLDEQLDIARMLNACEAKQIALEAEAVVLGDLFRALLEELMTGRLSALPLVAAGVPT